MTALPIRKAKIMEPHDSESEWWSVTIVDRDSRDNSLVLVYGFG